MVVDYEEYCQSRGSEATLKRTHESYWLPIPRGLSENAGTNAKDVGAVSGNPAVVGCRRDGLPDSECVFCSYFDRLF